MKISIVIPVLNEERGIREKLAQLQPLREMGHEIIVVDGGSHDASLLIAREGSDRVLTSSTGRARQMNAGANVATGDILVFLHIDTNLPMSGAELVANASKSNGEIWGRFNVRLSGDHYMFRVIETMMNWRSRLTGIVTGDQAMFVSKELFQNIGGFSDIPLMEDIEISTRLKKIKHPVCLPEVVTTSSRRWEAQGIYTTIFLMWRLRLSYWLGKDPAQLVHQYYR